MMEVKDYDQKLNRIESLERSTIFWEFNSMTNEMWIIKYFEVQCSYVMGHISDVIQKVRILKIIQNKKNK